MPQPATHAWSPEPSSGLWVRRIGPDDQRAALAQLAIGESRPDHGHDVQAFAQRAGIDLQLMWGGYRADGSLGPVVLVVPQAGRTGLVFTSQPRSPQAITEVSVVIDCACQNLPPPRVALAQVLLGPEETWLRQAFEQAGFWRLATLLYMQCRVPKRPPEPQPPPTVAFEPWSEQRRDAFLEILDASYRHTLDCPGLRGLRHTSDTLAGHMAAGRFDPQLWTLLLIQGRPAGVCLLNPVPAMGCVELVYLGLAPEMRQRGLGSLLMQRAFWLCAQQGQRLLTLAVDESNAPALRLYHAIGCRQTARRLALIRPIDQAPQALGS